MLINDHLPDVYTIAVSENSYIMINSFEFSICKYSCINRFDNWEELFKIPLPMVSIIVVDLADVILMCVYLLGFT